MFKELEQKINISFKDKGLLKKAFTHRSFLNENPSNGLEHNERLEFLGDAVLELVTTDFLYKKYPKRTEGDLTAFRASLVNSVSLAKAGGNIGLEKFLLLSRGETKDTGKARQYILANTFEALIGAIYLDQGYEKVSDFLHANLLSEIEEIVKNKSWIDSKSLFQEKSQEKMNITPSYDVLRESGPDHDKQFVVGVFLEDEMISEGEGMSKQEAEQFAAKKALKAKGWG
jgi:ribonuclease-3